MEPQTKTISVPQAGRVYLGIGRDASYEAARQGTIPVIRVGRLLRVPVVAMERKLERVGEEDQEPAAAERDAAPEGEAA